MPRALTHHNACMRSAAVHLSTMAAARLAEVVTRLSKQVPRGRARRWRRRASKWLATLCMIWCMMWWLIKTQRRRPTSQCGQASCRSSCSSPTRRSRTRCNACCSTADVQWPTCDSSNVSLRLSTARLCLRHGRPWCTHNCSTTLQDTRHWCSIQQDTQHCPLSCSSSSSSILCKAQADWRQTHDTWPRRVWWDELAVHLLQHTSELAVHLLQDTRRPHDNALLSLDEGRPVR